MDHEVIEHFSNGSDMARRRRRKRARRRLLRLVLVTLSIVGLVTVGLRWSLEYPEETQTAVAANSVIDSNLATVPVADLEQPWESQHFIDLPGEPLWLSVQNGRSGEEVQVERPAGLAEVRGQGPIVLIRDRIVAAGERVALTIPSTQADFAVYNAQRRGGRQLRTISPTATAPDDARPRNVPEARALQDIRANDASSIGGIGINQAQLIPSRERVRLFTELALRAATETDVASLLAAEGYEEADSEALQRALQEDAGTSTLLPGELLALRRQSGNALDAGSLIQAAYYRGGQLVAAFARDESSQQAGFLPGSDPWLGHELGSRISEIALPQQAEHQTRVLDAFYTALLRHDLPTTLVGQIIILMADVRALDGDADAQDRFTVAFSSQLSPDSTDELDGLLFVAIERSHETIRCYVYRSGPGEPYSCYGGHGSRMSAGRRSPLPDELPPSGTQGAALEALVDQIIQIESAGDPNARNDASDATGLGQFIQSTWLEMMRRYRSDLTATMNREQLLALRRDPDLSREMVRNLILMDESYLRARGHEITPGRIYLAHFLGMAGAHRALSAPPGASLLELYGAAVINANPHMRNGTAADIISWADERMASVSGRTLVVREPAGLREFRENVDEAIESL